MISAVRKRLQRPRRVCFHHRCREVQRARHYRLHPARHQHFRRTILFVLQVFMCLCFRSLLLFCRPAVLQTTSTPAKLLAACATTITLASTAPSVRFAYCSVLIILRLDNPCCSGTEMCPRGDDPMTLNQHDFVAVVRATSPVFRCLHRELFCCDRFCSSKRVPAAWRTR
jgi:hypothetical protein